MSAMTRDSTAQLLQRVERLARDIFNEIGAGLSESVYQQSLGVALREAGHTVELERVLPVMYHGQHVGTLRADVVVDGELVVELKVCARLTEAHVAQLRAYLLRTTDAHRGILVNFGLGGVETRVVHLMPEECPPPVCPDDLPVDS